MGKRKCQPVCTGSVDVAITAVIATVAVVVLGGVVPPIALAKQVVDARV